MFFFQLVLLVILAAISGVSGKPVSADRSDCNLLQKGFGDSVLSVGAKQQTEGLKNEPCIDMSKTQFLAANQTPQMLLLKCLHLKQVFLACLIHFCVRIVQI